MGATAAFDTPSGSLPSASGGDTCDELSEPALWFICVLGASGRSSFAVAAFCAPAAVPNPSKATTAVHHGPHLRAAATLLEELRLSFAPGSARELVRITIQTRLHQTVFKTPLQVLLTWTGQSARRLR